MRPYRTLFTVIAVPTIIAAFAFALSSNVQHGVASGATPQTTATTAIVTNVLGQGSSAVAPDRVLLLQRRSFASGADSGAHPAAGPTVLYVDSGVIEFAVAKGTALVTRQSGNEQEPVAAGGKVELRPGDTVFYDAGVVHEVANVHDDPAVTLEARLNPKAAHAQP